MTLAPIDQPRPVALLDKSTDSWVAVLTDVVQLATNIAATEFVPTGLRGSVPKVVAAIMHGRELGLPPMTALAQTFVIGGRPGTYAEMQRALILAAGHQFRIHEQTEARCVMKCRRSDWPDGEWATYTFTMQEATKAGYARTNANYQKVPADMLLARCTGRMAKGTFPDVIHGLATVEELMDVIDGEDVGYLAPVPQMTAQVSRQGASPAPAVESGARAALGGAAAPDGPGEAPVAPAAAEPGGPAAAGRKRAPLKPRGRATQPIPESTPEPAALPPEPEVVDAEVVEDAPVEPAGVASISEARAAARQTATTSVLMHFKRLLGDPVDREERLWYTGLIVERLVESTNDLDGDELRKVLKVLERMRNREQLEALNAPEGGE